MTKQTGRAALAVLCVLPFSALAQDNSDGRPSGAFELETLLQDESTRSLLDGKVDWMYRSGSGGAVGLGFDLGADATFDLNEGGQDYVLYGALAVDPGFGTFAIGAPRSIGDLLIERPAFAGNRLVTSEIDLAMPPAATSLAKTQRAQHWGMRYDNASGALRYGATAQKVDEVTGTFWQAAAEYTLGQAELEGMVEASTHEGGANSLLGINGMAGQVDYAVYVGDQRSNDPGTSLQAGLGYAVNDRLRVGGDLARVDQDSILSDHWGLNAQYGFGNGAHAQLGVSDGEDEQATWDASLGFKF